MTRLSVSRPTWSVPSRLCASGGLFMRRKSALSGSRGASSGAASATKMMAMPTRPPMAESVLRRAKRASSATICPITDSPRLRLRLAKPSAVTDARVEPCVAEIDQHVDHDEDHRVEQYEVLHHDDVALDHGDDERAPEPGHAEGLLDGHRAAEHEAKQHAGDGDHGQQRIGQRMTHDHHALAQSLGTRGANEVLADHLQQARA